MKHHLITRVLILAAVLSLLVCFGAAAHADEAEDVKLSNILFEGDEMNDAQKARLREINAILDTASVSQLSNYLYAENTSERTLAVQFYMPRYDASGLCVGEARIYINEWRPGEKLRYNISSSDNLRFQTAKIAAQIEYEGVYLRTAFRDLVFSEEHSVPMQITFAQALPYKVSFGSSAFTVKDFSVTPTGTWNGVDGNPYFRLIITLTKDSGKFEQETSVQMKIRNADQAVCYTDTISLYGIEAGETVCLRLESVSLSPGVYTCELLPGA